MHPMILKNLPMLAAGFGGTETAGGAAKEGGDLFARLLKGMCAGKKEPLEGPWLLKNAKGNPADSRLYLMTLRKALLARGGSLRKLSLSRKDFPLLQELLGKCGFGSKEAQTFLEDLIKDSSGRGINFEEFFAKLSEGLGPEKSERPELIVDHSELPELESGLRALGLTPKEADAVLESARADGGVSLKRLVSELVSAGGPKGGAENRAKVERLLKELVDPGSVRRTAEGKADVEGLRRLLEAAASGDLKSSAGGKGSEAGERIAKLESRLRALEEIGNPGPKLPDKGLLEYGPGKLESLLKELNAGTRAAFESPAEAVPDKIRATIKKIVARAVPDESEERPGPLAESLKKVPGTDLPAKDGYSKGGPGSKIAAVPPDPERKESFQALDRLLKAERGMEADEPGGARRAAAGKAPTAAADFSSLRALESDWSSKQPGISAREFAPGHVIEQVGKQLSRGIMRGDRVITLRLEPPDLGTLRIEMDVKENIVKLGIITSNHVSREILLSNVPELRNALAEQGLKLAGMDVHLDEDFGHALAHSKDGTKQDRNSSGKGDLDFADDAAAERHAAGESAFSAGSGLLDLVA